MISYPDLTFEAPLTVFLLYSLFYCLSLLAIFLVLFSSRGESLVSMPSLGSLTNLFLFRVTLVLCLLALAGFPPLAGFFIKSFFFFFTLSRGVALTIFFSLFNLMSLYFYLSSTRLLILNSKSPRVPAFTGRASLSPRAASLISATLLLLVLGPLFFDTAIIISLSLLS